MRGFVRAVKTVLPWRHPNLVTVYGTGKTGRFCWIAREYVEGASGGQAAERAGKPKWRRALRVAVHVGRALDFLYQHHQTHGNVTPQNVLTGSDKVTKLADLGLSRALGGSRLQRAKLEGKLLAELAYLAPEQMPGGGGVDICTDIYGLGAVVYTLLTGRAPFGGGPPEQTIAQVRDSPPIRPKELKGSTPGRLEGAVLRMLAKHPEDRYLTPAELLADLEPFAQAEGVTE
jgi:serine/threonine protein kinase